MSYGNKPKEIKHSQAALMIDDHLMKRVQSLSYSADLNSEDVYQLTDANAVEVVDADPSVSVSIDINEHGSINLQNILAGYRYQSDNTNTQDSGRVTATNLSDNPVDVMVFIKELTTGTAVTRALWFNNCYLDSISGTYQVDGFATESVALSGSNQTWFLNSYAGARVSIPRYVTTGELDTTLAVGSTTVYVTEDGVRLADTYWGQASDRDITAEGGKTFGSGRRYRLIYTNASNTFPTITAVGTPIGGVKEGEIEVTLWDSTRTATPGLGVASTAQLLRAQSVDYELSFDREDLKQLYTGTFHKGLNKINVTATVNVIDSDLEAWAISTGNIAGWNASTLSSMSLSDFQLMSKISMRIDIFNTKEYSSHNSTTLLKQIWFTNGKITSISDSRDVPGRGSQTLEIQFQDMYYMGTGRVGR